MKRFSSFEQKIHECGQKFVLSREERESIRLGLEAYCTNHPLRNTQTHPSTRFSTVAPWWSVLILPRRSVVASIAFLVCVATGGMTYAAEWTVPGDSLYPVKVNVNEELVGMFSFSDAAKVSWETKRAERRIDEAKKLAQGGSLTPAQERDVIARFSEHARRAAASAARLEQEFPESADTLSVALESALLSHEMSLVALSVQEDASGDSLRALAVQVRNAANDIARARDERFSGVSALPVDVGGSGESVEVSSEVIAALPEAVLFDPTAPEAHQRSTTYRARVSATEALKESERRIRRLSFIAGKDEQIVARDRMDAIAAAFSKADEEYERGDYKAAFERFVTVRDALSLLTRVIDERVLLSSDVLTLSLNEELIRNATPFPGSATLTLSEAATIVSESVPASPGELLSAIIRLSRGSYVRDEVRLQTDSAIERARVLLARAFVAREVGSNAEATTFENAAALILQETQVRLKEAIAQGVIPEDTVETTPIVSTSTTQER